MCTQLYNKRVHRKVALRKESVDRNDATKALAEQSVIVALRKESVDRNKQRDQ